MSSSFLTEVEYICKLVYDTFKLPVVYYNQNDEPIFEFGVRAKPPTFTPSKKAQLELLNSVQKARSGAPVLTSSYPIENFLSLVVDFSGDQLGTMIIGPSLYHVVQNEMIKGFKNDLHLTVDEERLKNYFSSLPIVPKSTLLHIGQMTYYLLYHKKIDILDIVELHNTTDHRIPEIENSDLQLSENRQTKLFHHSYLREKEVFGCITEGNKDKLFSKIASMVGAGQLGVLSKRSHIRNHKNLAITAITLATRAAMDGGLEQETAYTLSDLYIQTIEEAGTVVQVERIQTEALSDFTDRVKNSRQKKYSQPINTCQAHIFKNLYEDLSLTELADVTGMSPSYLSKLFKKEVGMSLSVFIQNERIDEAKKLLIFSQYSLTDIYTMLNFTDQSYFTKVFKKVTGMTPKEFKKSNG
ncbi:helix-turn-helix domain-containing protein [Halalkalibacter akibai]|uniref:Helix-turn-helix n=1 Tax=Halalkalibacter akibai (strain ATCC 43226 / DSM 21942 / CIP 109018 / JCM 9157 / 1139) TaxID=1236973 RepID=W4QRL4_HALA3|nr:helix-turn-helix domain-containing protein [Halalkalibacter akibai]GAE34741.1 helix-turn-helix [Halalkalibacter akibai JCM 9157]